MKPPAKYREEMVFIPTVMTSTNSIYAGKHFRERKKDKETIADYFSLSAARKLKPFDRPVNLQFYPVLGKGVRAFDTTNYSYVAKMIEDCMVKYGVLQDDNNKFVKSATINPAIRGKATGMLVVIKEQSIDHQAFLEVMAHTAKAMAY